jgi:hypothetical protein
MKKTLQAAFIVTILAFILLFFLYPERYTYRMPWSCASLPGVHSCPLAIPGKNSQPYTISYGKGPLITGFHKGGGFPHLLDKGSVIRKDGLIALFAGLLAYEAVDKYHGKPKPKKKPRK